ncbi:hypothetical protein ACFL9T_19695 [Thermodesulfobacteriota bacterium]
MIAKNANNNNNGIHNNSYFITLSLFLFLLFNCSYAQEKEEKREAWITNARSFVEADRLLRLNADKPSAFEYLQKRNDSEKKFKDCKSPSIDKIEEMLSSDIIENQNIACVAVYISGNYSERTIKYLVRILQRNEPFELKRFSLFALKRVQLEDLKPFEESIFQAIESENDKFVLSEEILFLIKFPPEKSSKIARNLLLNKEDAGIKRLSYGLLHKLGPDFTNPVLKELERKGDNETLKIIREMGKP